MFKGVKQEVTNYICELRNYVSCNTPKILDQYWHVDAPFFIKQNMDYSYIGNMKFCDIAILLNIIVIVI